MRVHLTNNSPISSIFLPGRGLEAQSDSTSSAICLKVERASKVVSMACCMRCDLVSNMSSRVNAVSLDNGAIDAYTGEDARAFRSWESADSNDINTERVIERKEKTRHTGVCNGPLVSEIGSFAKEDINAPEKKACLIVETSIPLMTERGRAFNLVLDTRGKHWDASINDKDSVSAKYMSVLAI